tara:strand:- start:2407 stop:2889 length:483 start_codon:yes stop_codon:yes gene_type:complete
MAVDVIEIVKGEFSSEVLESHDFRSDQTLTVKRDRMLDLFEFLRDDPRLLMNFLMDVTAVDYMRKKEIRFEVVYHLYSQKFNHRVRIKIPVTENDCVVESLVSLWMGANWFEREVWDLYGIKFRNHPNLRRILLYEGFKGHPLRKDYPINKRQPLIGPVN